jgi:protein involved in polysaccharide export with SLBB domain
MTRPAVLLLLVAGACLSGGCAALTNPVADGIPVRRLPEEVLGRPKADLRPVPLTMLRQKEPDQYRLDKRDVLAVVAPQVLGPPEQLPPVRLPDLLNNTAAIGYPVPVEDDGTIKLPRVRPLDVRGKTPREVEALIRQEITGQGPTKTELVKPEVAEGVSVQILQKRRYQVMVVREDSVPLPFQTTPGQPIFGGTKKGAGFTITLQAYENDVLRALNATGGPPGLDAKNEVTIYRGAYDPANPQALAGCTPEELARRLGVGNITRIPLRVYPDQPVTLRPEDIILNEGDIVYIEARDTEVYYTAGLIGAGQFPLPRDYDLDVLQAIAQVRGPLINGTFTQNAFVPNAVQSGIGNPNASLCTVLRQLPNGTQIPIAVDLNRAFRDPRERILIRPGDWIVLQERPGEALARYISQTIRFTTTIESIKSPNLQQVITGSNP